MNKAFPFIGFVVRGVTSLGGNSIIFIPAGSVDCYKFVREEFKSHIVATFSFSITTDESGKIIWDENIEISDEELYQYHLPRFYYLFRENKIKYVSICGNYILFFEGVTHRTIANFTDRNIDNAGFVSFSLNGMNELSISTYGNSVSLNLDSRYSDGKAMEYQCSIPTPSGMVMAYISHKVLLREKANH